MATSFKGSHGHTATVPPTLQQATANLCLCQRLLDIHGQVLISLLWGHCSFLLGPGAHRFTLCPLRVYFPVLCRFWQLSGGVNGDLLQNGLCHTQVCYTQSPRPCGSPLLTRTSTGDTQTLFFLSLCGILGSSCTQALFQPSESLQLVWGLILNVISPLLPSCWDFSFALGHGVSPQSQYSAMQPPCSWCSSSMQLPQRRKTQFSYSQSLHQKASISLLFVYLSEHTE